jgi:hypothetical protein
MWDPWTIPILIFLPHLKKLTRTNTQMWSLLANMKYISGEAQFDSSWISTEANGGFWQHICNGESWDSGLMMPVTEQPYNKTMHTPHGTIWFQSSSDAHLWNPYRWPRNNTLLSGIALTHLQKTTRGKRLGVQAQCSMPCQLSWAL